MSVMKQLLLIAIVLALVSSTISCIPTQPPTLAPTPESASTPEPTEDEVITTPSATRIEKLPYSWTEGIMLYTMELVEGEGYWQADRWDYYELRLDYQNTSHETTFWKLRVGEFKLKTDVGNVYGLESGGLHGSEVAPEGDDGFVAVVFKTHQGEMPVELWWYRQGEGQEEPDIIFKLETAPTLTPAPTPALTPAPSPAPTTVPTTDELEVHFINVGQGDSILIDLGKIEILIDGGGKSPGVVTYLNDYVDGAIEVMVATHPHADHIGGLIAVLEAFEVQEIWLNGDSSTSQTYAQFKAAVDAEGAEVNIARQGDEVIAGELILVVLSPATLSGSTNENSIVLSLSYGEVDFLFTGDAGQEAEASMLGAGLVPSVEVLKVGHHGSRTASSQSFLAVATPRVAIYMAKEDNSYGHPHEETIQALEEIGAEIYGTDISGTIIVTTDGEFYTLVLEISNLDRSGIVN